MTWLVKKPSVNAFFISALNNSAADEAARGGDGSAGARGGGAKGVAAHGAWPGAPTRGAAWAIGASISGGHCDCVGAFASGAAERFHTTWCSANGADAASGAGVRLQSMCWPGIGYGATSRWLHASSSPGPR